MHFIVSQGILQLLFLLFFSVVPLMGQQKVIDSLESILKNQSNTIEKVRILNQLAFRLESIDIEKSRKKGELALALATKLGDEEGIAIANIQIGRFFDIKSNYDSALQRYQKALTLGEQQSNLLVQAQALVRMGNTYKHQSNYTKSLEYLEKSLEITKQLQNPYCEAFALNIIGLVYQQQGKYDLSLDVLQKALTIREILGSKLDIAASLGNIGLVYDYKGDFPKALDYYFRALKLNEIIGSTSGAATTWNNIGIVYSMQGESDKALEAFQQAFEFHKKSGNKFYMAGSLDNIGLNYHERGLYVKALDIYHQTLTTREEIGDKKGIATSTLNIADIYALQDRFAEAQTFYEKALSILSEMGDQYGVADVQQNLGALHYKLKRYEKALEHYEKSLQIRQEIGNTDGVASSYIMIGGIHLINKNYDQAKKVYQQALEIAQSIGNKSTEVYGLKGLANAYFGLGNYHQALAKATQALTQLETSNDRVAKQNVHETLATIYKKLGQYEQAYVNQVAYTNLKDSILNAETSKQLMQMQVKFDTERKERLISDQEYEISLLATSNQYRMRLTWIGGISVLLLFSLIIIYRSRVFAIKAKNLHQHYSRMLLTSHEDERKRISMDLHDSVGQSLMLIKNKIVLDQDEETVTMVSQALEEVRTISKALHPVLLEKLGLTASIQKLITDFDENTEILFTEEIDSIDSIFSQDQELHIFRIVQETISNIVKHAKTPSALIKLTNDSHKVTILIKDYGIGFDITDQDRSIKSLGMKTLKERTQILGGKMVIDSVKNQGTSILLEIPKKAK
jgi:signal transduction histidine kinase/Tfp pilus assembly protein PilF